MNLNHVLAFHRVAAAGGFTVAARLSGVSQPTLSSQVRALERTMGTALFERAGRGVRLTPAGETLYGATARLSEAMDAVADIVIRERPSGRGGLRISADSAIHVLPVLAELKRRVEGLAFSLRIDNSSNVIAQVLKDEVDLGVMARPVTDTRLFSIKIREDRLVLLVGANDAWARRTRASIADLAGRDLVVREKGSITREVAEARIRAARIKTGQVFDVATREAVREAVAAGFGVGVIFASEAGNDARLKAVPIADQEVAVAEYAICRAERHRLGLVARFIETAHRLAMARGWLADSGWTPSPQGAKN
ncbi:MAG TPA: LysR substrate-binding domain-containing protein [Hyphomicrobiaceae bacterium]|nr:LysR substrate-binding domain-containing protein [Hyphomicrobiaceae bacterium]